MLTDAEPAALWLIHAALWLSNKWERNMELDEDGEQTEE